MNEEIKKEFEVKAEHTIGDRPGGFKIHCYECGDAVDIDELWLWIDEKLKEQYLQGAKDMREALKIGELDSRWSGHIQLGYEKAKGEVDTKAQQFIESLEKQQA